MKRIRNVVIYGLGAFLLLAALINGLFGGSSEQPQNAVSSSPTFVPIPTFTPTPITIDTPILTDTPVPVPSEPPTVGIESAAPISTDTPVPNPTAIPIVVDTPVLPIPPTPTPIVLSGSGQQASPIFELRAGLLLVDLSHGGTGHFGIWLLDGNGNNVDLLANDTGAISPGKALHIPAAGQYLLDISADGPWTAQLSQPVPMGDVATVPYVASGQGQDYSSFVRLEKGLHRFTMTHNETGHFGVWLLDGNGNNVDLLANDMGVFDGSKAVGLKADGVYLFDVSASGDWSIAVE